MSKKTWSTRTLRILEVTSLTILFLLIGAVTLVTFTTPAKKQVHIKSQPEQYIHAISASARIAPTTSTTQPKRVVVKPKAITQTEVVKPVQSDWVAQCKIWMGQAGIAEENWDAALYIIDHESDCSPTAQNPNSTAYGIGQFLNSTWAGVGCVKTPEPVEQLRCMNIYVGRHGGWQGSVIFKKANGWY